MSIPNWWGDWRQGLTPHTGNLQSTDLIECTMIVGGQPVNTVITGAQILGAVPTPSVAWGSITGTLSSQTDLSTALSGKASTGAVTGTGITMSTARILGRSTAGTGAIEEITIGTGLSLSAGTLSASGGSSGLTVGTTAIASGTIGRVLFQGTGNVLQQSANLFWDNTNNRLGIGTASPNMALDIRTGNVGIGITADAGFKLHVNGTARVVNNIFSGNGTYFTTGSQSIASASTANAYVEISSGASNSAGLVFSKAGSLSTLWQLYADSSSNIAFFRNGINKEIFKIFESTKNIGIDEVSGTSTFLDVASAKLFVNSTTKGFLPPRMTNAQMLAIAAPAAGLVVYDTTNNKHCGYNGTAWQNFY